MKVFLSFLLGVLLGVVGTWVLTRSEPPTSEAGGVVVGGSAEPADSLERSAEKIEQQLDRAGEALRVKAGEVSDSLANSASDARISATIKGRLIGEARLSAFNIDVDTSDRMVTLSGTVASPEDITRALEIARSTEGVKDVASTLQVKERD
jgi:osmotically-inducible protein OsmY